MAATCDINDNNVKCPSAGLGKNRHSHNSQVERETVFLHHLPLSPGICLNAFDFDITFAQVQWSWLFNYTIRGDKVYKECPICICHPLRIIIQMHGRLWRSPPSVIASSRRRLRCRWWWFPDHVLARIISTHQWTNRSRLSRQLAIQSVSQPAVSNGGL